jgi:aryl-phospho-beta-D-glucosidase BglC (GH1 family)
MVEWGFDFIRLPTDYRIWTISSGAYREPPLKHIDQVIEWARRRGIHTNLCLHRAPGYCVNPPGEPLNLWADDSNGEDARQQFTEQWRMLAARYQDISAAELSFNLVNEPPDISGKQYAQAVAPAIAAIRKENPNRLIIADGANYGRRPVPELVPLRVAQSTRGYEPITISHYRASWIDGSDGWPVPAWPIPVAINRFLYGDWKPEFKSPLILTGNFPESTQISIKVQQVSNSAELVIRANGKIILRKLFLPGAGQGEWKESVFREEWKDYLGTYDKEYAVLLPNDTDEIQIAVTKGDWLTFSDIVISPFPGASKKELVIKPGDPQWGIRQEPVMVDEQGNLSPASGNAYCSKETLWTDYVEPWERFSTQQGIGVFVGEWGSYNQTPHEVVLAWMKDCLENWKRAGMGWALWNLRGSFGVLDSDRADVEYENYRGHKLDRKMLELLREIIG